MAKATPAKEPTPILPANDIVNEEIVLMLFLSFWFLKQLNIFLKCNCLNLVLNEKNSPLAIIITLDKAQIIFFKYIKMLMLKIKVIIMNIIKNTIT